MLQNAAKEPVKFLEFFFVFKLNLKLYKTIFMYVIYDSKKRTINKKQSN